MESWEWPTQPLHIDYAGPIQGKMFLVAADAHSKWMEKLPLTAYQGQLFLIFLPAVNLRISYRRMEYVTFLTTQHQTG